MATLRAQLFVWFHVGRHSSAEVACIAVVEEGRVLAVQAQEEDQKAVVQLVAMAVVKGAFAWAAVGALGETSYLGGWNNKPASRGRREEENRRRMPPLG
jgi:hypothetical protein